MKKLLFRITSTLLVLFLLFSMWGCKAKHEEDAKGTKTDSATASASTTATTAGSALEGTSLSDDKLAALAREVGESIPYEKCSITVLASYLADKDIVLQWDGRIASGEAVLQAFLEKTEKGEPCTLKYITYYSAHGDTVEPFKKLNLLHFNGNYYKYVAFSSVETGYFIQGWKYLIKYEGEMQDVSGSYFGCEYCLVNDNTITYEDIQKNLYDSASSVFPPPARIFQSVLRFRE